MNSGVKIFGGHWSPVTTDWGSGAGTSLSLLAAGLNLVYLSDIEIIKTFIFGKEMNSIVIVL